VTTAPPPAAPAQVIDLMDALKQSLGKGARAAEPARAAERKRPGKAPSRPARRATEPGRRARAGGR
jgi:non-homologous end joining protein Ku